MVVAESKIEVGVHGWYLDHVKGYVFMGQAERVCMLEGFLI